MISMSRTRIQSDPPVSLSMSKPANILVADDEDVFRQTTVALLEREGYTATGTRNAEEARDRLRSEPYDLLVCDINMPGNTHLQLVEEVQSSRRLMPVIVVTGYPSVATAVPAVGMAIDGYLVKPVSPEEMLGRVGRALDRRLACLQIEESARRLEQWQRDLQRLIQAHRYRSPAAHQQHLGAFATLTLRNVSACLNEVRLLIQAIVSGAASPEAAEALRDSRPVALVRALHNTIQTLERTKKSFKSKELAALRVRLEKLLEDPPPPEAPGR